MFSDFAAPVQRDTSPSDLARSDIDRAVLSHVPEAVTKRFKRLEHVYGLSRFNGSGNDEDDSSKEQYLLLKV